MSLSKGTLAALPLLALPFTLASELDHYEEPGEYDVTTYPTASFSPSPAPSLTQAVGADPIQDGGIPSPPTSPTGPSMAPTIAQLESGTSSINDRTSVAIFTTLGVGGFAAILTAVVLQRRRIRNGSKIPNAFSDDSNVEV